jgi:glycerol-3-phosphate dehydrogenase
MYNPNRLALSYLESAVNAGADAANYLEVNGFIHNKNRVIGVKARDVLTGNKLDIRGKVVLNASGPWSQQLLDHLDIRLRHPIMLTKDWYLVIDRQLSKKYALAVPSRERDPEAIMSRGGRHYFIIPWRDYSLIGSSHVIYNGMPDDFAITENDIMELIKETNEAYPPIALSRKDVSFCNAGLVLYGDYYGKRSRIIDHARDHYVEGLVSVIHVRYTTSRLVAAKAINLVSKKLGRKVLPSKTAITPIYGGNIDCFDKFQHTATEQRPTELSKEVMHAMLHNYGSEYHKILKYLLENPNWCKTVGFSKVIQAEVIYAVREEMAQKLEDVVLRRTDLGTAGDPGESALLTCAALMAAEMKWNDTRVEKELEEVKKVFF